MLRSFMPRPGPLLSRLRRRDSQRSIAQLGRGADAIAIPSQGYYTWSSEDETDTDVVDQPQARKPVAAAPRYGQGDDGTRRHVYVVLDDLRSGFSIHKLDIDDDDVSDGGDLASRPPVHRLATPVRCGLLWNFAVLGSKIVAAGQLDPRGDRYVAHVFDTETAALYVAPALPPALQGPWSLAVAAGNGLHVYGINLSQLSERWWPRAEGMHRLEDAEMRNNRGNAWWWGDRWSWSSMLPPPPSTVCNFRSVGVHPEGGGRTMFVSVDMLDRDPSPPSHIARTYSYDTVSGDWKGHGEWDLPFCGQAHYDGELDAWVGLHKGHGHDDRSPDGRVCSCDVASPAGSPTRPAWKLCREKLFDANDQSHAGASLVHMGGSTYCVVEVMQRQRDGFRRRRCADGSNKCVIRLATFRLRYGKNGELTATTLRPDRFYRFSKYDEGFTVRAF